MSPPLSGDIVDEPLLHWPELLELCDDMRHRVLKQRVRQRTAATGDETGMAQRLSTRMIGTESTGHALVVWLVQSRTLVFGHRGNRFDVRLACGFVDQNRRR